MMKVTKFAALASVSVAALATPVLAAGPVTVSPDPVIAPVTVAPMAPASGDWTGAYGGITLSYGDVSSDPAVADGDGVLYGLRGGYDYDFGNFVVGGSLDYDWADIDVGTGGDTLDSIARAKVRGGYDFGRALVYGTGGYARATADVGGADLDSDGWVIGAGTEYMLTDSVSMSGEILYHRFDDFGGTGTDVEATTATVGVNYRF